MNRLLLDTGVVLRHLRGHQPTVQILRTVGKQERLGVAVITRVEIHAGMHADEKHVTQKLLGRFITFDLDRTIADLAGDLVATRRRAGHSLGVPDAIIAATAMAHRLTLLTYNRRHFATIQGLSLYPLDSID
jgi:predicted nucleic acid-binding protein